MARLMVLWADASLEYNSIGGDAEGKGSPFEGLDFLDPIYRRLYFWRSLAVTLSDGEKLLTALNADPEFRTWLNDSPELRDQFNDAKRRFMRNKATVDFVRNGVSAHVDKQVAEAPKHLHPDAYSSVELGGAEMIRPKFAFHLLLAALLPDIPEDRQEARILELLTDAKEAFRAWVNAAYIAVILYQRHYPLFPQ